MLSSSDSDVDSLTKPALRPSPSTKANTSTRKTVAPPKSTKTLQAGKRARRSMADEDDSDDGESQQTPATIHAVMQFVKQSEARKTRRAEKQMKVAQIEYNNSIEATLAHLKDTLDAEEASHNKEVEKIAKATSGALRKIKAAEDVLHKKAAEFEQEAARIVSRTQKDVAAALNGAPQSQETLAAVEKKLVVFKDIVDRHEQQHNKLQSLELPWAKIGRDLHAVADRHVKEVLTCASETLAGA